MTNWFIPIGSLIAAIYITVFAIQEGHPEAVWLYCDMLHFC